MKAKRQGDEVPVEDLTYDDDDDGAPVEELHYNGDPFDVSQRGLWSALGAAVMESLRRLIAVAVAQPHLALCVVSLVTACVLTLSLLATFSGASFSEALAVVTSAGHGLTAGVAGLAWTLFFQSAARLGRQAAEAGEEGSTPLHPSVTAAASPVALAAIRRARAYRSADVERWASLIAVACGYATFWLVVAGEGDQHTLGMSIGFAAWCVGSWTLIVILRVRPPLGNFLPHRYGKVITLRDRLLEAFPRDPEGWHLDSHYLVKQYGLQFTQEVARLGGPQARECSSELQQLLADSRRAESLRDDVWREADALAVGLLSGTWITKGSRTSSRIHGDRKQTVRSVLQVASALVVTAMALIRAVVS